MSKINNYLEETVEVIATKKERDNVFSVWFKSNHISKVAKPGQFINIQVDSEIDHIPILRRPFAISLVNNDKFEILYEVVGRGTSILQRNIKKGSKINVLGPLGNGFNIKDSNRKKLLIAGGLGIAPLKMLLSHFTKQHISSTLIWGNSDKSQFFNMDYYMNQDIVLFVSTDNGSLGFEGNVLDILKSEIKNKRIEDLVNYDIYVVGPTPMMKSVANYIHEMQAKCQLSLEEPMACGFGVCQGCAIRKSGKKEFYLVCKDGPVFEADKIDLSSLK